MSTQQAMVNRVDIGSLEMVLLWEGLRMVRAAAWTDGDKIKAAECDALLAKLGAKARTDDGKR